MKYFETRFLEESDDFISKLDPKAIKKIFYNIDLAEQTNDPRLFKKLQNEIWSSERNMQEFKSDCLHFGTKRIIKRLWLLRHTVF